jgi:hypothetical protein
MDIGKLQAQQLEFPGDYYSIFRLILNGYLERILIYKHTRDLIAFGDIELYTVLITHLTVERHLIPDPLRFGTILEPRDGAVRIILLIERRYRQDSLELLPVEPVFLLLFFR